MPEYMPEKLCFPNQSRKMDDDGREAKPTKMDEAREKNGALANVCENTKDYENSQW